MQFRISFATLAFIGLFSAASGISLAQNTGAQPAAAQPAGPKTGPMSFAVVDIGYLIKNHPRMNADLESLKAEMAKAQTEIEDRRKALLKEGEMIGTTFNADSPEFKQKQEQLLNQESKLRVDFMAKEKEFAEKQATVIYTVYTQINEIVTLVASHYQYDMVMRYNREQNEMDPKKPNTVNLGVQKDVIFHNPSIDVTEIVLAELKRRVPAAAVAPTTAPAAQTPRLGGNQQPPRR